MTISGANAVANQKDVINFTVSDGAAILKGDVLSLDDNLTVSGAAIDAPTYAGVSSADKVAADGSTKLGCYTSGIFDMTCADEVITVGSLVVLSGANLIGTALPADILTGSIVGKALETSTAGSVIAVQTGIY